MLSKDQAFKALEEFPNAPLDGEIAEFQVSEDIIIKVNTAVKEKYKLKDKLKFKRRPHKVTDKKPHFIKYPKKDNYLAYIKNRNFENKEKEIADETNNRPGVEPGEGLVILGFLPLSQGSSENNKS